MPILPNGEPIRQLIRSPRPQLREVLEDWDAIEELLWRELQTTNSEE